MIACAQVAAMTCSTVVRATTNCAARPVMIACVVVMMTICSTVALAATNCVVMAVTTA